MNVHPQIAGLLPNGREMRGDSPAIQHIPYTRFLPGGFLTTRNGDVIAVFKLQGLLHETTDPSDLEAAETAIADLCVFFDDGRTSIYTHTIRRKVNPVDDLPAIEGADFAASMDKKYRSQIAENQFFETSHYLTLVRQPAKIAGAGLARSLINLASGGPSASRVRESRDEDLEALKTSSRVVKEMLGAFQIRQMGDTSEDRRETLRFLTMLSSGIWMDAPDKTTNLAAALPVGRMVFRDECLSTHGPSPDMNRHAALLSISSYAESTQTGLFDDMFSEPIEFILTQSFTALHRIAATQKVKNARGKMKDAGDDAVSLIDQLLDLQDGVASRSLAIGRHHFSIAVLAETSAALDEALPHAVASLSASGFRVKREDLGLELSWWAQLPGNMNYQIRSAERYLSNKNMAEMAAFHAFPKGSMNNLQWGGPVTVFSSSGQTPYYFSFHREGKNEPGTTAVFGASGAGKTAFVNFLLAQTRRLPTPPDIISFDKDRGSEAFIGALGGDYMRLRPGLNLGFNPFATATSDEGVEWLTQFIMRLSGIDKFSPEQTERIASAAKRNSEADEELRTFSSFADLLRSVDDGDLSVRLREGLSNWHSEGSEAWLFGNSNDTFSLDRSVIGFDMTALLDTPVIRSAVMDYIFYRIEQKLDRGRPTIIVLDEAWKLLDDPRFQSRIKDWIKTIRKKNGIIIFMTQEPADAAKSAISETLIQSCDNKIFFGNAAADEDSYMRSFRLTRPEFELVRAIRRDQRAVLIKNIAESLTVSVRLQDADPYLRVLSGTAESVEEMERARAEHGSFWLSQYMYGRSHADCDERVS